MKKLTAWAKSHKIAAGAIGCGGLIVVGFVLLIVLGLILTAFGYEVDEEPEAAPTTQVATTEPTAEPAPETTPPAPSPEPTTEKPKPSPTPTPTPEPEPTTEEPEPPADPDDVLAAELSDLDGLDVFNSDGGLMVSFDADVNFDITDKGTTVDIINATHEVYTDDYRYLMVTGSEGGVMWSYSYDKDTVEAIATGYPIISEVWEYADRGFDPR